MPRQRPWWPKLKTYRVGTVVGDQYAGEWPREAFRRHGVEYRVSDKVRSELYLATLPLINAERADLLDVPKIVNQFMTLERRTGRSGKDMINHAPGGHDDLVNAIAGALVSANDTTPRMTFHMPIVDSQPRNWNGPYRDALDSPGGGYASAPPGGWPAGSPQAKAWIWKP
jgi:hypothetical protein